MEYETYADKLSEVSRQLKEAFKALAEAIDPMLDFIKEYFKKAKIKQETEAGWYVPQKMVLTNQVLNRKPRMAVARSRL
jgi:hypothetical protein